MTTNRVFEQIFEIGNRRPAVVGRQQLAERAEDLSRAGEMQTRLDACVAATVALINVLYETDADGTPANIDRQTGRILIPVPWGASGWRKWGLRQWQAGCYRRLLLNRVQQRKGGVFDYDPYSRQWFVDVYQFADKEAALLWLKTHEPSLREWRPIAERYRLREMKRKAAARGR